MNSKLYAFVVTLSYAHVLLPGVRGVIAPNVSSGSCWDGKSQDGVPRHSFQWPKFMSSLMEKSTGDEAAGLLVSNDVLFEYPSYQVRIAQAVRDIKEELHTAKKVLTCQPTLQAITKIKIHSNAQILLGPSLTQSQESYSLYLHGTTVTIHAETDIGARHALVTLQNLLELRNCNLAPKFKHTSAGSRGSYFVLPYKKLGIVDGPRLRHRGLMLDTSRHYFTPRLIKRVIKVMARSKMNVFHWHATDDQSFPLVFGDSARLIHGEAGVNCVNDEDKPCLGAYSNDQTYTAAMMSDILNYADLRGVRVILEVDMPAHARSWGSSGNVELTCADLEHQTDQYCAEPICGSLNLKEKYDQIMAVARTIVSDIHRLKGYNREEYIHVGMDEVFPTCWGEETRDKLMMRWLDDIVKQGMSVNRRLVVWQDVAVDHKFASVPESARDGPFRLTAQVWNNPSVAKHLLERKHDLIWSNYEALYLDCGRGNAAVANLSSWCSPYKSWWDVYAETPDAEFFEYRDQILGGEVCMWAEQANELSVETLLWPRAAAWAGAAWESRAESPINTTQYQELIFDPQDQLEEFMLALSRECIPTTPMRTQWCGVGDTMNTKWGSRKFCNHYAEAFMKPAPSSRIASNKTGFVGKSGCGAKAEIDVSVRVG